MRKVAAAIVLTMCAALVGMSTPTTHTQGTLKQVTTIQARNQVSPVPWHANGSQIIQARLATESWYRATKAYHDELAKKHTSIKIGKSYSGDRKACVTNTENHGDYGRSTNPGHFGRYQFSRPTWIAYGGNPDTWGHASAEEQDEVFERAWNSPGGPQNWLPYDGC